MKHELIKKAAFDSFDRDETSSTNYYDPNYYDPDYNMADGPTTTGRATNAVQKARPGQKMQINLTLSNPTAQKIIFDIFNAYENTTNVLKPELVVASYSRIPGLSFEGQAAYPNNIDIFDQAGNLMIRGSVGLPVATIGCSEYPYSSLLDTTKNLGFQIVVIRVSVATQAQFNNNIDYVKHTYAGVNVRNTVNVRSYKRLINPTQLDIDVKVGVTVTGESGLLYALEPGEVVQWGLYINQWAKPNI